MGLNNTKTMLLIIFLVITSCKDLKKRNEKTESFKDTISNKFENETDKYFEILKKSGFVFPSEEVYINKVKDVFGLDLSLFPKGQEVEINSKPIVIDDAKSYPFAINNKKFVLWFPDPSTGDEAKDNLAIVNLNKYIFYNDKAAFLYLKSQTELDYLYSLIQDFGYTRDHDLVDFLFKKTQGDITDSFAFNIFFGRNGVNGRWELRKTLFDNYLDKYPKTDIYGSGFTQILIDKDNADYITKYEGNREADLAFLLEKIIYQARKRGDLNDGAVDEILETHPDYLALLNKNKAYGNPLLNDYIRQGPALPNYRINDLDGYTNLRKEKNTSSQVLQKIITGEEIIVLDNSGDWWLVESKEGKKGYVYKTKIKEE